MVTALRAKEERIKSIEAGAEDFISKPIDKGRGHCKGKYAS